MEKKSLTELSTSELKKRLTIFRILAYIAIGVFAFGLGKIGYKLGAQTWGTDDLSLVTISLCAFLFFVALLPFSTKVGKELKSRTAD